MSFEQIVGQDRIVGILQRGLQGGRVSHAYLFSGREGVGKRRCAELFIKALNCTSCKDDACDQCASCRAIENEKHPDISRIDTEGSAVKIEQIRQTQRFLSLKPSMGRWKAVIIEDADLMTIHACNALLKTLEEPPPSSILILISSRIQRLPLTVRSRCQQLRFAPLSSEVISELLSRQTDLDFTYSLTLARHAQGSIKKALSLASSDSLDIRNTLISNLCVTPPSSVEQLMTQARELSKQKEELPWVLDILRTWYRDLLVTRLEGPPEQLINQDYIDDIYRNALQYHWKELIQRLTLIDQIQQALERNVNPQLALEHLLTELSLF